MMNPESVLQKIRSPGEEEFVVEGRWCVEALLESGEIDVLAVLRAEGCQEEFETEWGHRADVLKVSREDLSEAAGYHFHRGLIALARRPLPRAIREDREGGLLVACPALADAANLGAIVRSAAALGAAGILVPHRSGADIYARKSIRASSGAVFRLPVFESEQLDTDLESLRESGYLIMGTSLSGATIPVSEAPDITNGVILFGPEDGGLSSRWRDLCDLNLTIPMSNEVDSLNVAASAAIILYELVGRKRGNRI